MFYTHHFFSITFQIKFVHLCTIINFLSENSHGTEHDERYSFIFKTQSPKLIIITYSSKASKSQC